MSSPCRVDARALLAAGALVLALAGCERERREYHASPTREASRGPRLTPFQPGQPTADRADPVGRHYENSAYHVGQGARLYRAFNCNGCHALGGGAIGPALMDPQWRYGGRIDQIHATILEGRPNGMPSWRGRITDQQAWQLAAYVRALSGNVRKDARPGRAEGLSGPPPLTQMPAQEPDGADPAPVQVPQP